MSRVENFKKNSLYSIMNNFFTTIISFVTRTLFIQILGAEYLGLNGLFTNVLGILSLADLGITNAITFSLYKPLAENNEKKIGQVISFLGKAYRIIGLIILLIGISLIPFLDHLVNFDTQININYYCIFILFLLNSVSTYLFFSYKSTIIYAAQKSYLTIKYEMIFTSIMLILQLCILQLTKNYYLYLVIPIIINILKNYKISKVAEKLFPIIKEKHFEKLNKFECKNIAKNVYSIAMLKISGVIYSSTDNLIISAMINTTTVGYYSNYLMILNVVKQFVSAAFNSLTASIGDLNASESVEYKFKIFKKLNLFNCIIYGYCFTCLLHLFNPFIEFWIGNKYTFDNTTVLLICLTFLIPGLNNIINIYKDGCGLFWETRYRTLATAIVNIVVSIILGKCIGINGILLGTIIAYLTTIYIFDPIIVFRNVFKLSPYIYYLKMLYGVLFILMSNLTIAFVRFFYNIEGFIGIIILLLIITVIYFLLSFLFLYKTDEYKEIVKLILAIIKK